MADQQRKVRDGLVSARQKAADALVGLRADRAKLDGERQRVAASTGPIQYLAAMAGLDTETAIRWLFPAHGPMLRSGRHRLDRSGIAARRVN
jgi:hypothetical protein